MKISCSFLFEVAKLFLISNAIWNELELELKRIVGIELGRRYDLTGNLTMWWSESLLKEFQTKADCFIQQYSDFTIDHINKKVSNSFLHFCSIPLNLYLSYNDPMKCSQF